MWLFICLMFLISGWMMYAAFATPEKNVFSKGQIASNGGANQDAAARWPQRATDRRRGGDGSGGGGCDGGGGGCG